jgi:hypothetical protein
VVLKSQKDQIKKEEKEEEKIKMASDEKVLK